MFMYHYVTECKVTSSWDIESFPITAGLWLCAIFSELSLVSTGTGVGVGVPKVGPSEYLPKPPPCLSQRQG